ncbi:hypothetical protein P692DRAFT_20829173 [Suillus brevipes Sb2]|nr:hypothetical protein P692DRAFT_20829173 [Suillus brevipes Sb2]
MTNPVLAVYAFQEPISSVQECSNPKDGKYVIQHSRSALRNGICECRWRYEVDLQISLGSLRQQCMFGSQPQ